MCLQQPFYFALLLAVVAPALADAQGGSLTGAVVDGTGGVRPGATITLVGGPSTPRRTQTDAEGRFAFAGVSPGLFTLTVSRSGFGEVTVDGVEVAATTVESAEITLRLAAFNEAVVVSATRIEEPPHRIPMSISALTGADIRRRAVENLTD